MGLAGEKAVETVLSQKRFIDEQISSSSSSPKAQGIEICETEIGECTALAYSRTSPKYIQGSFAAVPALKAFVSLMETRDLRIFNSLLKCVHMEKTVPGTR